MKMDCVRPLEKRIGVIRGISISEKDGGAISGKGSLLRFRWVRIISGQLFGFLASGLDGQCNESIRKHERNDRHLGSGDFVSKIEAISGRVLRQRKPGRKALDKAMN